MMTNRMTQMLPRGLRRSVRGGIVALLLSTGCSLPDSMPSAGDEGASSSTGNAGRPCFANGTCHEGLVCEEGLCRLPRQRISDGGALPTNPASGDAGGGQERNDSGSGALVSDGGLLSRFDAGPVVSPIADAGALHESPDAGWGDLDDDQDGLSNKEELVLGADCAITDPANNDTDGDGLPDGIDAWPLDPHPAFVARPGASGGLTLKTSPEGIGFDTQEVGEGLFGAAENLPAFSTVAIADFRGTGKLEILVQEEAAVGSTAGKIWLLSRPSIGPDFSALDLGAAEIYRGFAADVNGDSRVDWVSYDFTIDNDAVVGLQLRVFLNTGAAEPTCFAGTEPEANCLFAAMAPQALVDVGQGAYRFRWARQLAHLNPETDDHPDLVVAKISSGGTADSQVFGLLSQGDGTFAPPSVILEHPGARSPANSVVVSDVTQDGYADLLLGFDDDGDNPGAFWLYLGDPAGGFAASPVVVADINPSDESMVGSTSRVGLATGNGLWDLDSDGYPDLVVGFKTDETADTGDVLVFRGHASDVFREQGSRLAINVASPGILAVPSPSCVPVPILHPGNEDTADGGIALVDAGAEPLPTQESGYQEPCGVTAGINYVCGAGLVCEASTCEETCFTPGVAVDECMVSEHQLCRPSPSSGALFCAPMNGLLLELSWGGSENNMDLYLKPGVEEWCSEDTCSPGSCLNGIDWNSDANIGPADPIFITDDSCGSGPEVIYFETPIPGPYTVGVHRKNTTACANTEDGDSLEGTLKLYVNGILYNTYERDVENNLDLWKVMFLDWQASGNLVVQEFHQFVTLDCNGP